MNRCFRLIVVAALVAVGSFAESVTIESLLEEMVDRSRVAQLDAPSYTCRQFSSYNRGSVAPDQPGWFANADQSQFLRTETVNGREENVMMDAEGPGAIVRWWLTMAGLGSGRGTLRIYRPRLGQGHFAHLPRRCRKAGHRRQRV